MRDAKMLLRVVRYRPVLFLISVAAYIVFFCAPLVGAVFTGHFLDILSGNAVAGQSVWTALALVAVAEGARIAVQIGLIKYWANFITSVEALLRPASRESIWKSAAAL